MISYHSLEELAHLAREQGRPIACLVLEDQAEQLEKTPEELMEIMDARLTVMEQSAAYGMREGLRSNSGLTGGEGLRMKKYSEEGGISGSFCTQAMAVALSVAGCNAAMGRIVASPTAGSCGILPGAILPMMEQQGCDRKKACMGLFTASAIGMVIAQQASIAGAEGGCQAECGSASAMAAGALVEMRGGTPEQVIQAAAIAIKNQMGLVCDPVAGLVEVPCVKRNAGGVMCATGAAEMALAGIESVVPPDEVILAMKSVGDKMPEEMKETAQGGLAATQTGRRIALELFGNNEEP